MKNKGLIILVSFFLLSLFVAGSDVFAQAQNIKAGMKARLSAINALKAKGVVVENNKGFLEFREDKKEKDDVVDAENADRSKIYELIAKKQGTTPGLVGKRRALKIAKIAKPGEWIQAADGNWYKKK